MNSKKNLISFRGAIRSSLLVLASISLVYTSTSKAEFMTNSDIKKLNNYINKRMVKPIGASDYSANIYLNGTELTMLMTMSLYPGGQVSRHLIESGLKKQCSGLEGIFYHYLNVKKIDLKVKLSVDGNTHNFSHICYS